MGQSERSLEVLTQVLRQWAGPLVLDADALNLMAAHPELTAENAASAIITPHPGEMARLLNSSDPEGVQISDIVSRPVEVARQYAARTGYVTVLKGARTVISDGEETYLNLTGNEGMATGGSGDVLTGIIGSCLAQGMGALDAARTGVLTHGVAGDEAAKILGTRSVTAGDIADHIPYALHAGADA